MTELIGADAAGPWIYELGELDALSPEAEYYIDGLPERRMGHWEALLAGAPDRHSIEYAKSIQAVTQLLPVAERLDELLQAQPVLDEMAADVRGRRMHLTIPEGAVSVSVGGYTVDELPNDGPHITLRAYELNPEPSFRAAIKANGQRAVGVGKLPVSIIERAVYLDR